MQIWNVIALVTYRWLYNKPEVDSDSVQYTLMFIPVIKALQMLFVLTSLLLCAKENFFAILVQNFVMMLDLAAETALRTAITAILYLIATVSNFVSYLLKGWGTLRTLFSYEDCDKTAKILGVAYFIHSAYFLTTFVLVLHDVIRICMMSFYLFLTLAMLVETRRSIRSLNIVADFSHVLLPMGQLQESIKLKKSLITKHVIAATCYFVGVVGCLYFLQNHPVNWTYYAGLILEGRQHEERQAFMTRYIASKEAGEIIVFVSLLIIWRPRRWP